MIRRPPRSTQDTSSAASDVYKRQMTGSRQVGHVARELNRRGGKYGIVTMCVGGGMGATGLFEAYQS